MKHVPSSSCSRWHLGSQGTTFHRAVGLRYFFLAVLLCGAVSSVWAHNEHPQDVVHPHDATHGSLLFKTDQRQSYHVAPLLSTQVTMKVTGLIARAHVYQEFMNPTEDWVEGVYVFPLPDDAAIDHLRMKIGDRLIEGDIQEKTQAKRTYSNAKTAGKRASLLEQERPNIFTASVANIGPGDRLTIEIEYQQTVSYDQGQFRLRFPLAIGPRYIPGIARSGTDEIAQEQGFGWSMNTDQVPDASRVTPPVLPPKDARRNHVQLSINLAAGVPLSKVHSTYHPVHVRQESLETYSIQLQQKQVPADRDFELTWTREPEQMPRAAWFTEEKDGETYALLMMFPPMTEMDVTPRQRREVVFVIDTSGSMHGTSIQQAQSALVQALDRLSPHDSFNIIQFNDRAHSLFAHAQSASLHNRSQAIRYIEDLHANGGTEMLPAIEIALHGHTNSERLRQVIFMTDGQIGNEEALFAAIQKQLGTSRLFTVGIGSAPNSYFMNKAASFGRGTFTYIGNIQEVGEKIQRLLTKLEHPVLKDITLELKGREHAEVFPAFIPDLYLGEPVLLAAKTRRVPGQAQLRGRWGGKVWNHVMDLESSEPREGIATFWARRKISSLMDRKIEGESTVDLQAMVVAVAIQHHLVSRYTSLVAVDRTPVRPHDRPVHSLAVPTNLPHGQSHIAIFGLPQTATFAPFHMLLGVMSAVITGMLWYVRKYVS